MKVYDTLKLLERVYRIGGGNGNIDIPNSEYANLHNVLYEDGMNGDLPDDFMEVIADAIASEGGSGAFSGVLSVTNTKDETVDISVWKTTSEGQIVSNYKHLAPEETYYFTSLPVDAKGRMFCVIHLTSNNSGVDTDETTIMSQITDTVYLVSTIEDTNGSILITGGGRLA